MTLRASASSWRYAARSAVSVVKGITCRPLKSNWVEDEATVKRDAKVGER
jgi:hypothetical protein